MKLVKEISADYFQAFKLFVNSEIDTAINFINTEIQLAKIESFKENKKETEKSINLLIFKSDLLVLNNNIIAAQNIYLRLLNVSNDKKLILKYALFLDLIKDKLSLAFPYYEKIAETKFNLAGLHSFISFRLGIFFMEKLQFRQAIVSFEKSLSMFNSNNTVFGLHSYKIKQKLGKAYVFVLQDDTSNYSKRVESNINFENAVGFLNSALNEASKEIKYSDNENEILEDRARIIHHLCYLYSINLNQSEEEYTKLKIKKSIYNYYHQKNISLSFADINEMYKEDIRIFEAIMEEKKDKKTALTYGRLLSDFAYFNNKKNRRLNSILDIKKATCQADLIADTHSSSIEAQIIKNITSKISI